MGFRFRVAMVTGTPPRLFMQPRRFNIIASRLFISSSLIGMFVLMTHVACHQIIHLSIALPQCNRSIYQQITKRLS